MTEEQQQQDIHEMPSATPEESRKQVGPLIGAAIIIVLMMVGGLYFWGAKLNKEQRTQNPPPLILGDDGASLETNMEVSSSAEVETVLPPQSNSDEPGAIEQDLAAMNMDGFAAQTEGDVSAFGEAQ